MQTQPLYLIEYKRQLLEFIEEQEEPFDVEYLVNQCNQPISYITVHDALCELMEEGRVVKLQSGLYLPTEVLMRRWIKSKLETPTLTQEEPNLIELSHNLKYEVKRLIKERPELGYENIEEFVRDAIRRYLTEIYL